MKGCVLLTLSIRTFSRSPFWYYLNA